jgi:hypothetical protein
MLELLIEYYDMEEGTPRLEFIPQGMRESKPFGYTSDGVGGYYYGASMLRDRILQQGRVLPNGIIDVSAFMESYVDMVSAAIDDITITTVRICEETCICDVVLALCAANAITTAVA